MNETQPRKKKTRLLPGSIVAPCRLCAHEKMAPPPAGPTALKNDPKLMDNPFATPRLA